jgi:hypothetical protein
MRLLRPFIRRRVSARCVVLFDQQQEEAVCCIAAGGLTSARVSTHAEDPAPRVGPEEMVRGLTKRAVIGDGSHESAAHEQIPATGRAVDEDRAVARQGHELSR